MATIPHQVFEDDLDKRLRALLKRTGATAMQVHEAIGRVNPECLATDEEREVAEAEHASDECEIDNTAWVSHGDDGYWVQAWVWVEAPRASDESDEIPSPE